MAPLNTFRSAASSCWASVRSRLVDAAARWWGGRAGTRGAQPQAVRPAGMHPPPARNAGLEPEGVSLSPRVGAVTRQRPLRAQTVSVSEPPALVLNEPGYYRVRIHDPRLPLRSGNSWRGGLLLPLS